MVDRAKKTEVGLRRTAKLLSSDTSSLRSWLRMAQAFPIERSASGGLMLSPRELVALYSVKTFFDQGRCGRSLAEVWNAVLTAFQTADSSGGLPALLVTGRNSETLAAVALAHGLPDGAPFTATKDLAIIDLAAMERTAVDVLAAEAKRRKRKKPGKVEAGK